MNIIQKIKDLFRIGKVKQIEAPKEIETSSPKDEWKVTPEQLKQGQEKTRREQQREFQLMFALKNVCGKSFNLYGEDMQIALQSTLSRFGYENDISVLDDLDLSILRKVNMEFNNENHDDIIQHISNSENPSKEATTLINSVRGQALAEAQKRGFTQSPKVAKGFVETPIKTFRETIEASKKLESEIED